MSKIATPRTFSCSQKLASCKGCPSITSIHATRTRPIRSCKPTRCLHMDESVVQSSEPLCSRRAALGILPLISAAVIVGPATARVDDYAVTPTGLRFLDVRIGDGATPVDGDTVEVHWAGRTQNYQAKRIDNTSVRDEPYIFKLGSHQAIPAFEEAVASMRVGGIRRLEILGEIPALSYPRKASQRFTDELISPDGQIYKYRFGPQPHDFDGQRALDFILDNDTLADTNRTLLMDIKLLAVRKARA